MAPTTHTARPSLLARWWIYQRERFPLAAHGPLVAAFSGATLVYSAALRGAPLPGLPTFAAAFATSLLFFLLLRIADEFKDAEEDRRYRPDRPVPRGLVTLRGLTRLGVAAALVQLGLAAAMGPRTVWMLAAAWAFFAAMTAEFGVPRWLRARPSVYLLSHMIVVPLIDALVTSFEWGPAGAAPAPGLGWLLGASYAACVVVEVGRKVRAPEDEAYGVETYTAAWGHRRAMAVWWAAAAVSALASAAAAFAVGVPGAACLPAVGLVLLLVPARAFVRHPTATASRRIEGASGAWVLLTYGSIALAALLA